MKNIVLLLMIAASVLTACSSLKASQEAPATANYKDGRFYNPGLPKLDKSLFSYLKMRWFSDVKHADQSKDAHKVAVLKPEQVQFTAQPLTPQVSWLGHSAFLIQYQGKTILTDPNFSDHASPISFAGPQRLTAKPFKLEDLPPINVVVISHDHYDHLDKDTIQQLGNQPLYIVPLNLKSWFIDNGIAAERVVELNWWQQHQYNGLTITATPSQHWSGRGLFDRMKTLWAAWHIDMQGFSVWFAGDTGYNSRDFKAVGDRWQGVDLALIPIGGYAPRWFMNDVHVDPGQAIKIHNDVRAKLSIGMHWGTFQMTSEPMMEPRQLLEQGVHQQALEQGQFITLAIGETRTLPLQ
jgi:N-acyl-phosphatidylethanolamine-hydrolysing phospholipase D